MDKGGQSGFRWRKKPIVIEAVQWTGYMSEVIACVGHELPTYGPPHDGALRIATLEGDHACLPGDWIIRGIAGELYPCKPEIFAETYEPAETPQAPETGWQGIETALDDPMRLLRIACDAIASAAEDNARQRRNLADYEGENAWCDFAAALREISTGARPIRSTPAESGPGDREAAVPRDAMSAPAESLPLDMDAHSQMGEGSSSTSPSPLDAARHSSDVDSEPSGRVKP